MMALDSTSALGFVAAICTTASWIPQALKNIRSRSDGDFSWTYLLVFTFGVACWAAYGWLRRDYAVLSANVVTLALLLPVIAVKHRQEQRKT